MTEQRNDDTNDIDNLFRRLVIAIEKISDFVSKNPSISFLQSPPLQQTNSQNHNNTIIPLSLHPFFLNVVEDNDDTIDLENYIPIDDLIIQNEQTIETDKNTNGKNDNTKNISKIEKILLSYNILVRSVNCRYKDMNNNRRIKNIALFIGERFCEVKSILDFIKNKIAKVGQSDESFVFDLSNKKTDFVSRITNLCKNLYDSGLLSEYCYKKTPYRHAVIVPAITNNAIDFYLGRWLELFVKHKILSYLQSKSIKFSYLCNVNVWLPNKENFEFDMLFEINDNIYWVESKSSKNMKYIKKYVEKYSKISKIMNLDRTRVCVVVANGTITDKEIQYLTQLYGINVVRVENFTNLNSIFNFLVKH